MSRFVVGIDVGGTNIKLGIVNRSGKIIARSNLITKSYISNKKRLIAALMEGVKALLQDNQLKRKDIFGIGIGLPGLIDPQKGIVKFLPNIPGWKNVPLKRIFQSNLRIPTFIDNDVNLMTLGEWKFGAGIGIKNMICLTLGTGVGGGLILNNNLYRGEGFAAGELGHMPINESGPHCNCGGYACFESYVGNRYLNKVAARIFRKKSITLQDIGSLARKGNARALKFWKEVGTTIGNGLTGVVNLLNPTTIIIGGGVANNHKFIFPAIRKTIKKRAMKVQGSMVRIVKAKLGNDAAIIGASVLVKANL